MADTESKNTSTDQAPIARLKFKRGTASEWETRDVVLADGQPGYDKTNNRLKIGDGKTTWSELPYISINNTKITSVATNFIVEETKNNSYFIRKWNSGFMECFGFGAPTTEIRNMFSSILYEDTSNGHFEISGYSVTSNNG